MFLSSITAVCVPGRQGSAKNVPPGREPAAGGLVVSRSRQDQRRFNARPVQLAFGGGPLLSETEAGPCFPPLVFLSDRAEALYEAGGRRKKQVRHIAFMCNNTRFQSLVPHRGTWYY